MPYRGRLIYPGHPGEYIAVTRLTADDTQLDYTAETTWWGAPGYALGSPATAGAKGDYKTPTLTFGDGTPYTLRFSIDHLDSNQITLSGTLSCENSEYPFSGTLYAA